jgi:hypothetical protein
LHLEVYSADGAVLVKRVAWKEAIIEFSVFEIFSFAALWCLGSY